MTRCYTHIFIIRKFFNTETFFLLEEGVTANKNGENISYFSILSETCKYARTFSWVFAAHGLFGRNLVQLRS